jgi:undecaprenyl-diphosphatase
LAEFAPLIHSGQIYINVLGPVLKARSFPSGHTQTAFAVAIYLSLVFRQAAFIFITLACLVGLARVYAGVHYPLDVVVGAIIGSSFSVIMWKWRVRKVKD